MYAMENGRRILVNKDRKRGKVSKFRRQNQNLPPTKVSLIFRNLSFLKLFFWKLQKFSFFFIYPFYEILYTLPFFYPLLPNVNKKGKLLKKKKFFSKKSTKRQGECIPNLICRYMRQNCPYIIKLIEGI